MSDETRDHRKMLDVVAAWFDEADMAKAAGDVRLAAAELETLRARLAAHERRDVVPHNALWRAYTKTGECHVCDTLDAAYRTLGLKGGDE